jgi:phage host-nuclease inhibitor protein Gam
VVEYECDFGARRYSSPIENATLTFIRELGDENKTLRELLEAVAQDLEAISSKDEYAPHTEPLQARAMRIRERLSER